MHNSSLFSSGPEANRGERMQALSEKERDSKNLFLMTEWRRQYTFLFRPLSRCRVCAVKNDEIISTDDEMLLQSGVRQNALIIV